MAVVFAGNGVFELQGAGIIKVTPVGWLGAGLPALGIHPSVQPLSVQGLLLLGAALAVILPRLDGPRKPVEPAKVEATVSERN
jgi:high-affinity iron transporter